MNFLKGFTTNFCQTLFAGSLIKPSRLVGKNVPAEGTKAGDAAAARTEKDAEKEKTAKETAEKTRKAAAEQALKTAEGKVLESKHGAERTRVQAEFTNLRKELQQAVTDGYTEAEDAEFMENLRKTEHKLSKTTYEANRAALLPKIQREAMLKNCKPLNSATEVKGKTLAVIAKENGMKMDELIRLNQSLSPADQFAVAGLTPKLKIPYCREGDTVYVYTTAYLKGEKSLGETQGGEFSTTTPRDQLHGADIKQEDAEHAARAEKREASTRVMDTREAIEGKGGSPHEAGQRDRIQASSIYLAQGTERTLDPSLSPIYKSGLFQKLNWEDWQKDWKDVVGKENVETLLDNSPTFRPAGFNLAQYMEAIKKGANSTLSFYNLVEQVYGAKQDVRKLVQTLAGRPLNDKVLKRLKGNFKGDYDRLLTDLTVEQKNPKYSEATGNVTITLEKRRGENARTATYEIPLNDVIGNKELYEVKQEGGKYIVYYKDPDPTDTIAAPKLEPSQVEKLVAKHVQNIYMSPEGKFMSGDGTTLNIPADNEFAAQFADERAALGALEQIYRDTAELFDETSQLRYAEASQREYQSTMASTGTTAVAASTETERTVLNEKETVALRTNLEESQEFNKMVSYLDQVFNTDRSQKLTRRYRGLITLKSTAKDQITQQDVDSHQFGSRRKVHGRRLLESRREASNKKAEAEDVWQSFSGEGIVSDVADRYVSVERKADGSKEVHFDQAGAIQFLNTCLRLGVVKREGVATLDTCMAALKIQNFDLATLTKEQKDLLRVGYFEFARAREVSEVQKGKEAHESQTQKETQLRLKLGTNQALAIIAGLENQGTQLTPQDRQALYQHLIGGVGIGLLRTEDRGLTRTTNYPDGSTKDSTIREANTNDKIQVSNVGVGLNAGTFKLPSGRSISLGVGGNVSTLEPVSAGSVNLGAGIAYSANLGDIEITVSGGASVAGDLLHGGVGGGIRVKIPAGPAYIALDGGVVTGGIVEAGVGVGVNYEHIYTKKLEKAYEKNGFTAIEELAQKPGTTRKALSDAILANQAFANVKAQARQLVTQFPGINVESDPTYYEYVISAYEAAKNDLGAQTLDRRGKPYVGLPCEMGVRFIHVVGTEVIIPVPYLAITVGNTPLVYRSASGQNYEGLSEARVLEAFDKELAEGPDAIMDVPKMARDPQGNLAMVSGTQNMGGELANGDQISALNRELSAAHLHLTPTQITPIHKTEEAEITKSPVQIFELQVDDVDGNMEIVIDPALVGKVVPSYQVGKTPKEGDKYYLAFNPGTPFYISRQNYHYPFANEGAYEKTVVTISSNPYVTEQQLALYSQAPRLVKYQDKPTRVEAPRGKSIPTLEEYQRMDVAEQMDWSAAIETTNAIRTHNEKLGTVNLGEVVEAKTKKKLETAAKKLMSIKDSPDSQFRKDIKDYTTASLPTFNLKKAAQLCAEKATTLLTRAPTAAENQLFLQAVTSYSYTDIHSKGLAAQQAEYARMTEKFTRPLLVKTFTDLKKDDENRKREVKRYAKANPDEMADLVIKKLGETLDFTKKGQTLAELGLDNAVFGSQAGTEGRVGIRITEDYRNDTLYKILSLAEFTLDAPQESQEYYAARAIVDTLNPIPEKEVSATNLEATRLFLIDDFTQRISGVWHYRNRAEAVVIEDLIVMAKKQPGANEALKASLKDNPSALQTLKTFQKFIQDARTVETAPREAENVARRRIQIAGDYYLSFQDVRVAYGVFERCGNNSSFLNERMVVEYKDQSIAVEDDSHRMVATQTGIESHGVGTTGMINTNVEGGNFKLKIRKDTIEEAPNQSGTATREALDTVPEEGDAAPGGADEAVDGEKE